MTGNDLILHQPSTPDSCGVRIVGSALYGRDLDKRLWFMVPSRPVCPRKVTQRRRSWSAPAPSACKGWADPGAVRPLQRTRPNPFSSVASGYEAHTGSVSAPRGSRTTRINEGKTNK